MKTEVGEMGYKNTGDDHSETVMDQLADSVLGLSDEALMGEVGETGADTEEEAERTRSVLHAVSKAWALKGSSVESAQMIPKQKLSSLKR